MNETLTPHDNDAVVLTYHRAFNAALREPANHLEQLENLARGLLRFSTAWMVHTFANVCLLVMLLMAVSPADTVGLWEAARTAALDAAKVRVIAIGENRTHITRGSAPDEPRADPREQTLTDILVAENRARQDAQAQASHNTLTAQPSDVSAKARELLSEILKVAMLGCALVGLAANTGGFTNVYAKVARERVQQAESLVREQALQTALANRVTVALLAALRQERAPHVNKGA